VLDALVLKREVSWDLASIFGRIGNATFALGFPRWTGPICWLGEGTGFPV